MVVEFHVLGRKRPKLTPFLDAWDLQIILLSGLLLPYVIWLFTGLDYFYTVWAVVGYLIWMFNFKVGKPQGYWNHWLSHKTRGKLWTIYPSQPRELFATLKVSQKPALVQTPAKN